MTRIHTHSLDMVKVQTSLGHTGSYYFALWDKVGIEPVLRRHKLVAFVTNQGWVLIRRCDYIDVYIDNQPYNSVQVLFHVTTKVKDAH